MFDPGADRGYRAVDNSAVDPVQLAEASHAVVQAADHARGFVVVVESDRSAVFDPDAAAPDYPVAGNCAAAPARSEAVSLAAVLSGVVPLAVGRGADFRHAAYFPGAGFHVSLPALDEV